MSVNIRVQLKLISSETVTQLCIFTTGNEYMICSLHLFKKSVVVRVLVTRQEEVME